MTTSIFQEFTFDGQKSTKELGLPNEAKFPLALEVLPDVKSSLDVPKSIEALRQLAHSGELGRLIRDHGGAILFRGLPIKTAQDYSDMAHAFGFRAHTEVGRPPIRTVLAKNVKTANEGPPDYPIWPHNEYGWSTINPAWLTFSALSTAEEGGQTPINSSIGLAAELQRRAPNFVDKLRRTGCRYVYRYDTKTVQSNTGTSVVGAYGEHVDPQVDDDATRRAKIEAEVCRHSNRFQWHDDGSLSVTHVVPVLRTHAPTGLPTFFGNITSAWGRSTHHKATRPPFLGDDGSYHPPPQYGDGTPMEPEHLDLALSVAEAQQVLVDWQVGDLVLLDNYAVMHSRSPWKGSRPRTVLAALWDDTAGQKRRVEDDEAGQAILATSPWRPIEAAA